MLRSCPEIRKLISSFLFLFISAALTCQAQVLVTTFHNDQARTGQNLSEVVLTPSNVGVNSFGKLYSFPIQGNVYAQPLYVPGVQVNGTTHNVIYVATEHDVVYAFDADNGNPTPLWSASFTSADGTSVTTVPASDTGCPDLTPELGITGTPVIDMNSNTMYLVARTKESGSYFMRLHALDITSGAEKFGGPTVISATVPGTGEGGTTVSLNTFTQNQRAALVFSNNVLYIPFGSLCDTDPYHGWVLAYQPQNNLMVQLGAWNSTPNGLGGGIWGGGAAPAVDGSGNLLLATSNGDYNFNTGGTDISDTLVKLPPVPAQGSWTPLDYFTPYNQGSLSQHNLDLGSGGTLLLPDQPVGSAHVHLMTVAGKQGTIYLVDRDNLGGYNKINNSQIVQVIPNAMLGVMGMAAWWNNTVYYSGRNDVVRAFTFDPVAEQFSTTPTSTSPGTYQYILGSTPSVSANNTTGAILWTAENDAGTAVMHAYDATNLGTELWNSRLNGKRDGAGGGVRFMFPTIVNGKVYLASNNKLGIYGLFMFVPGSLSFASQAVGTNSASQNVTVTNPFPSPMNITGITTTGQFGNLKGSCTVSGGVVLAPGTNCTVSVQFTPQTNGPQSGTINLAVAGTPTPYTVPLSGTATDGTSITVSPTSLNLGTVTVGQTSAPMSVTVSNVGSSTVMFNSVTATAPFSVSSNTCVGALTGPFQCSVSVTLTPTAGAAQSGTLTISSNSGSPTVKLTGSGAAIQFVPASLAMGTVKVGTSTSPQSVTVNVLGTRAATIGTVTIAGTNPGDFTIASDTCSGQVITGGGSCTVGLVFTPTVKGHRYMTLKVPNNDGPANALLNVSGVGQ
jgi:hypothetical protein